MDLKVEETNQQTGPSLSKSQELLLGKNPHPTHKNVETATEGKKRA